MTSIKLDLGSERIPPEGSTDAESVRNVVGRTDLGLWELLLRESFQNSWDQVVGTEMTFSVKGERVPAKSLETLASRLTPVDTPDGAFLSTWMQSGEAFWLSITDTGTKGLGGPTRAGIQPKPNESRNFVDFVRNNGRHQKTLGGGTFGFGKGVFFDASITNTCLIYSQAVVDGAIKPRLILMTVRSKFAINEREYTGRHWWGLRDPDDYVIEPLLGDDATDFMRELGLLQMASDATGTTVTILGPVKLDTDSTDEDSCLTAVEHIRDAALKWCWPHLIDNGGKPSVDFSFEFNGENLDLPDIRNHEILKDYAVALEAAITTEKSGEPSWPLSKKTIQSQRPKRTMGTLVLKSSTSPNRDTGTFEFSNHVALMRGPHIVVKYEPCSADIEGNPRVGVFVADASAEQDFARAEPATHDDWKPQEMGLARGQRNPVKTAITEIQKTIAIDNSNPIKGAGQSTALVELAGELGMLVNGLHGAGSGDTGSSASAGGKKDPPIARLLPETTLEIVDGHVCAVFSVEVSRQALGKVGRVIRAVPVVILLDGANESTPPIGAQLPRVIDWKQGDEVLSTSDTLDLPESLFGAVNIRIQQPAETRISLKLELVSVTQNAAD